MGLSQKDPRYFLKIWQYISHKFLTRCSPAQENQPADARDDMEESIEEPTPVDPLLLLHTYSPSPMPAHGAYPVFSPPPLPQASTLPSMPADIADIAWRMGGYNQCIEDAASCNVDELLNLYNSNHPTPLFHRERTLGISSFVTAEQNVENQYVLRSNRLPRAPGP